LNNGNCKLTRKQKPLPKIKATGNAPKTLQKRKIIEPKNIGRTSRELAWTRVNTGETTQSANTMVDADLMAPAAL